MKDFIVNEFGKIISKACERFSKEESLDKHSIQIVFKVNEQEELVYLVLKKYEEWKEVEFNRILGVRIDLKGYGMIVPPFIKNLLAEFATEMDKPIRLLRIMSLITNDGLVSNYLYYKDKFVKKIDLEEIL